MPPDLKPPIVRPGYEVWLDAFWRLSSNRPITPVGVGKIPHWTIRQFCQGWSDADASLFELCMIAMDVEFVRIVNKTGEQGTPEEEAVKKPDPMDEGARAAFRSVFVRK